MTEFKFTYDWRSAGNDPPEYFCTMTDLALHVGRVNLMKNEDIWSRTIRESVLVSAYPLAIWLASSWWRLNWEPLPANRIHPSLDWRMAHELGAANQGFVWPQIIFASDGEMMQVWAVPSRGSENQSVRYLNGLNSPVFIPLADFQHEVQDFIATVINRLHAVECHDTDLSNLWQIIQEDRSDKESSAYRSLEAKMGYDPDECPAELMDKVLSLEKQMGTAAISELAPVYSKSVTQRTLTEIEGIAGGPGLIGKPAIPYNADSDHQGSPWERAVTAAGRLRQMLGNPDNMIKNATLCELLGIKASEADQWSPVTHSNAAIAVPSPGNQFKYIPRKKHPLSKRFELARFIGDCLLTGHANGQWLTSTDLRTSRQKYQRAFAAEFLCPITSLQEFLHNDYSESAVEDAADHFQVSTETVNTLLVNNGMIPSFYADTRLPYQFL